MGCCNSIVVAAPAEKVWARIRDFHDLGWAKGVAEKVDAVGPSKGDQIGAKRVVNDLFQETLVSLNDLERSFSYTIDDAPGTPVARDRVEGYVGSVQVFPVTATGESFVLWTSRWESGSAAVPAFCNPVYKGLLQALHDSFAR